MDELEASLDELEAADQDLSQSMVPQGTFSPAAVNMFADTISDVVRALLRDPQGKPQEVTFPKCDGPFPPEVARSYRGIQTLVDKAIADEVLEPDLALPEPTKDDQLVEAAGKMDVIANSKPLKAWMKTVPAEEAETVTGIDPTMEAPISTDDLIAKELIRRKGK